MMKELKLQMAATILTAHVRHGYNITDPSIVSASFDAAEALIAESDRREAETKGAKAEKPEEPKKPQDPKK